MKNINEKYLWNSSTLEKITGGKSSGYWECQGIEIDSRKVKKGDLFMALTGKNFDGHNFIQNSISSGAKAAMVKKGFIESQLSSKAVTPNKSPVFSTESSLIFKPCKIDIFALFENDQSFQKALKKII